MDSDNLIFSSKIDSEVEDVCYDILLDYFSNDDYREVYVTNVVLAPYQIIFFVKIEGVQSIIRFPIPKD